MHIRLLPFAFFMFLHERDNPVCMLTCKHDFCGQLEQIVDSSVTSQPEVYHSKYSLTVQCTVENSPVGIYTIVYSQIEGTSWIWQCSIGSCTTAAKPIYLASCCFGIRKWASSWYLRITLGILHMRWCWWYRWCTKNQTLTFHISHSAQPQGPWTALSANAAVGLCIAAFLWWL